MHADAPPVVARLAAERESRHPDLAQVMRHVCDYLARDYAIFPWYRRPPACETR